MKPPAGTQTEQQPQLDNIQLLLQRRAELARNKAKYALTETDAQLLTTHSTEVHFADGQTIIEEFKDIHSVYRVRSGKVLVSRNGFQFNIVSKGWFIGDSLLIYNSPAYTMRATMVAQGPVVLDQLNIAFVQQLFKVDSILKAKFMRFLVSKWSAIFINILNDLENPSLRGPSSAPATIDNPASLLKSEISSGELKREDSTGSLHSDDGSSGPGSPSTPTSLPSTPSSGSLHSTPSSGSLTSTPSSGSILPTGGLMDFERPPPHHHHHPHIRKDARTRALQHAVYKSYPLQSKGSGVQTILIKNKALKVVSKSFGFSFKTTIEYGRIQSINKVGDVAATIVYQPRKVANVFFKNYYDREEFIGIVNSLLVQPAASPSPTIATGPLTVPHDREQSSGQYEEVYLCGGKEHLCKSQQTIMELKKGDVVFEEGDLFQRVYTLVKGHCNILQKGKQVCTMEVGDVFGVATLLYLRPAPVSVVVASDTAQLVYIPAYKLNSMLETDVVTAGELYQHAAITLDKQIGRAVGFLPSCKRILRERSEREARERSDSAGSSHSSLVHSDSNSSNLSSDVSHSSLQSEGSESVLGEGVTHVEVKQSVTAQ